MSKNDRVTAKNIFTEFDDTLIGEISRDPLGMQVIWSYFGQNIFHSRLTSNTPDIRNYTLNLFHHHVIRSLCLERAELINHLAANVYKNTIELKTGLIIFLENLLAHTFYTLQKQDEHISGGILGIGNATRMQRSGEDIILRPERNSGVLVNQISQGINGRYKGPFIRMKIIDRYYNSTKYTKTWAEIEAIFSGWQAVGKLSAMLKNIIADKLFAKKKKIPTIRFKDATNPQLSGLYRTCFATPSAIPARIRSFWKEKMGLDTGAAGALFEALLNAADKDSAKTIFERASRSPHVTDPAEKQKLLTIRKVEPFLAVMQYLFNWIVLTTTKNTADIVQPLEKALSFDSGPVQGIRDGSGRLRKLVDIFVQHKNDAHGFVKEFLEYHTSIMDSRGLPPWFTLDKNGFIKHTGHSLPQRYLDELQAENPKSPKWIHDYYLGTLRGIHKGLTGDPI